MAEGENSLGDLFKQARSNQENLDTLDPRSDEFKELLTSCIASLNQCSQLVERLSLFSPNEEVEDVSTSSLQFLGIRYLLADLDLKSYSTTDRKGQLGNARKQLEQFIDRMNDYDLLTSPDRKLFETFKENRQDFRIVADSAGYEAKRNVKIRRFQEEKQLKSRLKLLREQSQSLNVDDETVRDLYLAELSFFVHQTFQSLDLISQELQVLASMPRPSDIDRSQESAVSDTRDRRNAPQPGEGYSERLDSSALLNSGRSQRGILDSAGRPLQPFTITSKRTDLRRGVFRPDHSLPTMSIEEYLEEEHKRGGIIGGGGPQSEQVAEPDEDDVVAQDAATMKAREWDTFVEANPKGAGNTINRG